MTAETIKNAAGLWEVPIDINIESEEGGAVRIVVEVNALTKKGARKEALRLIALITGGRAEKA
jgi:hypothetical protein